MSSENAFSTTGLSRLHQRMLDTFSLDDLRGLCLDLSIDYEDLPGEARPRKIRELLLRQQQRNRLPELIEYLQELRPHIDWASFQPAEPEAEPPFKGLQYFSEQDAHLFFGRDALTAELIDHLNQHRFLAVVGASGSGKSSVVRAGLVPAIRRGAVALDGQPSDAWPVHIITPGDEPLKALAATLTRDAESVTAMKTLLADMRADTESLDLWLYRKLAEQETRLVLLVDQFEELFTQCHDLEERRLFVENLVQAVQSGQQGRLSLILTLRADFYAYAVQFEALRPLLETRQKIVGAMTRDELRQAIEDPAAANEWQFQPGLVESILADVGASENRQPEPGALPLLSHALLETWHRREGRTMTLAGYQAVGGVRKAIATTADRLYQDLTLAEQRIARHIFLRLTELGEGTEDTRRRASLAELMPQVEGAENVQDVLQRLANARLVTTSAESAEVAHEALIREWPALRQWLDENREGLRIHRQLTAAAKIWQQNNQDASYLYRGAQLERTHLWQAENDVELNVQEADFLSASKKAETDREQAQEDARKRELKQLQQLAEAEQQRADIQAQAARRTRRFSYGLAAALIVAVGAIILAFWQLRVAQARQLTTQAQVLKNEGNFYLAALLASEANKLVEINEATDLVGDIPAGTVPAKGFSGHSGPVNSVAWSAGGRLASGSDDGTVIIWDEATGQAAQTLSGHSDWVWSVAWSADGRLASGSSDRTVIIWDEATGQAAQTLSGHSALVLSVAWSADGRLASGSSDRTVRAVPEAYTHPPCHWFLRNLTETEWLRYKAPFAWSVNDATLSPATITDYLNFVAVSTYQPTCPNLPEPDVAPILTLQGRLLFGGAVLLALAVLGLILFGLVRLVKRIFERRRQSVAG